MRRRRVIGAICAVAVTAWLLTAGLALADPRTERPGHVDVVLVLGPIDQDGRMQTAMDLVHQGVTSNLLVSNPLSIAGMSRACRHPQAGFKLYCFRPKPDTTQGEARQLRDLAARKGWRSAAVVTSRYHLTRARMIVERCWSGPLAMIPADGFPAPHEWAFQLFYQTGASVKALLQSGC